MQIWRRFNLAVRSVASAEITARDEEKRVESSGLSQVFVSSQGQGLVTSSVCTGPVGHQRDAFLASSDKEELTPISTQDVLELVFKFLITRSEAMSNTC